MAIEKLLLTIEANPNNRLNATEIQNFQHELSQYSTTEETVL